MLLLNLPTKKRKNKRMQNKDSKGEMKDTIQEETTQRRKLEGRGEERIQGKGVGCKEDKKTKKENNRKKEARKERIT